MRALALLVLLLAPLAGLEGQNNYFVNASGPGGDGSSWNQAFRSLGQALSRATTGDRVLVARGVYVGNFYVSDGVEMFGGYGNTAGGWYRAPTLFQTILDANGTGRVVHLASGARLDGFIVRNGVTATGGAGALADSRTATIGDCIFTANRNTGGLGAALLVERGASPIIYNSIFAGNLGAGPAIHVDGASGIYANLAVHGNSGDGMSIQSGAATIENATFTSNAGRGINELTSNNSITLRHCHFDGNGVAHYRHLGNDLTSIAAINALSFASGNVGGAPRFRAPAALDFALVPGSPLIDVGLRLPSIPSRDLNGQRRPYDQPLIPGSGYDIGPLEFLGCALTLVGTPQIGTTVSITIDAPGEAGESYVAASSLTPGVIPLPAGWYLHMGVDTLFFASATGRIPLLSGYNGVLSATGKATATIVIPNLAALRGVRIDTGCVILSTATPPTIDAISDPLAFTIV